MGRGWKHKKPHDESHAVSQRKPEQWMWLVGVAAGLSKCYLEALQEVHSRNQGQEWVKCEQQNHNLDMERETCDVFLQSLEKLVNSRELKHKLFGVSVHPVRFALCLSWVFRHNIVCCLQCDAHTILWCQCLPWDYLVFKLSVLFLHALCTALDHWSALYRFLSL